MEDLSGDLEKDISSTAKPARVRMGRNWQVLFVDDHGEMITLKWVKPLAIVLIGLLVISIGICTAFLSFYMKGSSEARTMQDQLKQSEERIKSLRYELDILMARVVLAESANGSKFKKKKKGEPVRASKAVNKKGRGASKKTVPKSASDAPAPRGTAGKKVPLNPYEEVSGVLVEDLALTHEIPDNLLRVKFIVRNKERDRGALAGYVFVILKGDESHQKGWLAMPPADLTNGMPGKVTKGQYFKISHYKTVHLKARHQSAPEKYKMASVLVYGPKGTVLYEDTRPVTIKTIETRPPVKKEAPGMTGANEVQKEEKPAEEGKSEMLDDEIKNPELEALPDMPPPRDGAPPEEPAVYY